MMVPCALVLVAALAVLAAPANGANVTAADYQALAAGVGTIATGSFSGSRIFFWGSTMAIASDGDSAMIAAGTYGSGRVFVAGHEAMLNADQASNLAKLVRNAAKWAAGGKATGIRIATNDDGWTSTLAAIVAQSGGVFTNAGKVLPGSLSTSSVDVYIANGQIRGSTSSVGGTAAAPMQSFVSSGGGLLIAAQTWYYGESGHPINQALNKMGFLVSSDGAGADATLDATTPPSQWGNIDGLVACLDQGCRGTVGSACVVLTHSAIHAHKSAISKAKAFADSGAAFLAALGQAAFRPGVNLGKAPCVALRELAPGVPPSPPAPLPAPPSPPLQTDNVTASDYAALAAGVGSLSGTWAASSHWLWGPAMAVGAVPSGAFVSATKYGAGRALHFAHEGMLSACQSGCGASGFGRLVYNAALWAGSVRREPGQPIRVAGSTDGYGTQIAGHLAAHDSATFASVGTLGPAYITVSDADLYIVSGYDAAVGTHAATIRAFVAAGGGILVGNQGWSSSGEEASLPVNALLNPMGILVRKTSTSDAPLALDPSKPPPQLANVGKALECLVATMRDKNTSHPCYMASDSALTQTLEDMTTGLSFIPWGDRFWQELKSYELAAPSTTTGIDPSKAAGVPGGKVIRRSADGLGAFARGLRYRYAPVDELDQSPDAAFFPGLPPAGTQPISGTETRTVNGSQPAEQWECLGLWTMAGSVVQVTVPQSLVSAGGASLHIGGWTDFLHRKAEWSRLPDIVRRFPINNATSRIASAFGGLIYIKVPSGRNLGPLSVQVSGGAIWAPYFVEGVSDPADWPNQLNHPAPWGEIRTTKVAIVSPRSSQRKMLPTADKLLRLVKTWNTALDACAEMAGIDPVRKLAERFQHDIDISAGYMHSGYPIMTFMDVINSTLDPKGIGWGHFHELGHNHARGEWMPPDGGEVVPNFFSAIEMYRALNITTPANFYGWWGNDYESRYVNRRAHKARVAAGEPFDAWADLASVGGLMLDSYFEAMEDPRWQPFELLKRTLASYWTDLKPSSEDVRQFWIKRQSQVVQLNMAPYYKAWGWPVEAATEAALASLPVYQLPANAPPTPPRPPPPPSPPAPPVAPSSIGVADYQALAAGVGTIATGSFGASKIWLYGDTLAVATQGDDPLIAAGTYGKGRVVVYGHEAMLGADLSTGLGRLVRNSVLWAAGSRTAGINLATNEGGFAADLLARLEGWNSTLFTSFDAVAPADLPSNDYAIAVYIANGQGGEMGTAAPAVRRWVAEGGGLVIGAQTWYKGPAGHPANLLLNEMGFIVSGDSVSSDATLHPTNPPSQWSWADGRVACLDQACRGTGSCTSLGDNGVASNKWLINQVKPYARLDAAFLMALVQATHRTGFDTNKTACAALKDLSPPAPPPTAASPPPAPAPPSPLPPAADLPPSPSAKGPPPPPAPAGKAPPPRPPPMLGLTYTLLRGNFSTFPSHSNKVLERGTLTRLGTGYSCNPLLPTATAQACISRKYRTLFALRASGRLRVAAKDVKGGKAVQLLLGATGAARVTVSSNGSVVSTLSITGAKTAATQTASVALPVGDADIVVEWVQASGTASLKLLWRTAAVLTWAAPALVAA